ncbi:type I restriction enzyme EcoEI specificity protein [Spirochaetia bacterium]|nr:type I restriction enzyme EcoEI specificity protein [Spirochaetia bacterium]
MSDWQTVKVASFLTEREGRYKPDDKQIRNIPRLDKIDFSGTIHLSSKPTKTDMIIVYPGDLIISGINVAKGAIAIWEGDHPITATIHYSSYTFDKTKIDIDFFKRYLKSPVFVKTLQAQVKGGIKTEIKAKHLLPLEVSIPPLPVQKKTNNYFESFETELSALSGEIGKQTAFLAKLRQAVLQEAIEGKLTADWRKANPVRKGDVEYDAAALLDKIKVEKQRLIAEGKIRKEKPLAPIGAEDVPFALPKGWVLVRLGEIILNPPRNGYSPKEANRETDIKSLKLGATTWGTFNPKEFKYIDDSIPDNSVFWLMPNNILIQRSNSIDYVGVSAIYTGQPKEFIYPDLMMKIEVIEPISVVFIQKVLSSPFNREYYRNNAKGVQKTMPKITQGIVSDTMIPLPPLAEQRAVVLHVEKILAMIDELEAQVKERKGQMEGILQAVLGEAFEGGIN